MSILVFDVGGTNTRVGISHSGRRLNNVLTVKTPRNWQRGIRLIEKLSRELAVGYPITHVIGGIAAPLDQAKSKTVGRAHLGGWFRKPIKAALERTFHVPVRLENDAALGALGEAVQGAGKGSRIVGFLTIGTGIGGARIVNGQIDVTAQGFEPGHQIITSAGQDLESLISGRVLEQRYRGHWERMTSRAWKQAADYLAIGLVNLMSLWSPHRIVLGGTIVRKGHLPMDYLRRQVQKRSRRFAKPPRIVKASLGDPCVLVGALSLPRPKH